MLRQLLMSDKVKNHHCLNIKYKNINQQVILANDIYSIGRHSSNKIVINSETISRFHCTILPVKYQGQKDKQLFWIIDGDLQGNRSSNGVFVNGNKCLSHELKAGDIIKFGSGRVEIDYEVVNDWNVEENQIISSEVNINHSIHSIDSRSDSIDDLQVEELLEKSLKTTLIELSREEEDFFLQELLFLLQHQKHPAHISFIKIDLFETIIEQNNKFKEIFSPLETKVFCQDLVKKLKQNHKDYLIREVKIGETKYTQYARLIGEKEYIESYIFSLEERMRVEQKLRESEEKYRAIVRQISEGIILVDPTNKKIIEANNAYCSLVGYSSQEITSLCIHDLIATDPEINNSIIYKVQEQGLNITQESIHIHRNHSLVNVEVNISNVFYGAQEFICYAVRDVTERKVAEDMLRYQACHDSLTKLANRNLFNEKLALTIDRVRVTRDKLAVIFIDLDRFKNINDTLGHDIGDLFLQQVASKLKECLQEKDLIARWGGDEFTILLPEIKNRHDVKLVAHRILDIFKQPLQILDYQLYCHLSMGIAVYPEDGIKPETLVKNADTALYQTKDRGGNYYRYYTSSMNEKRKELLELESYLYEAIKYNQFQLYYQPQINFQTKKIVGMEALVRWQHPQLGTVSPNQFIPLAEQTGLINAIGEWALSTACEQNKRWQDLGLPHFKVSVNLSPRQCQPELPLLLTQILEKTKLAPHYLELEITENSIMIHPELTQNILEKLTRIGVSVSMDDFGTGYSSLGYLKKFPFHTLKIDQTFVQELKNEPQDLAIISAIVTLGRGFNLQIIAEGVETLEQLKLLTDLECDIVQGYLFSRPLPVDEATNFIRSFIKKGLDRFLIV